MLYLGVWQINTHATFNCAQLVSFIELSWLQPASLVWSWFILSLFMLSLFDWKLNCRCVYFQHKKFFPRWWKLCSVLFTVCTYTVGGGGEFFHVLPIALTLRFQTSIQVNTWTLQLPLSGTQVRLKPARTKRSKT